MIKFAALLALAAFATAAPSIDTRIDFDGDWRVVGGSAAATGAYPFVVSLRTSSNSHFCGGSVLNTQWILTAAHCLVGFSASNVYAVVGTNTLASGGSSHQASRLIVHGSYDDDAIVNDIGVIRLSSAISYSSSVAQVSLNTANTGAAAAILIGWGRLSAGGSIPNNLQQLNTNTITVAQCQSTWGTSVSSSQICAFTRAGQGACNGDSGGPLVLASNLAQVGIVSYGYPCALGFPDVYARVSSYISWINSAVAS